MLISHSKRFIFVHVIKTGGTSIKHALSCYDSHPDEQHAMNQDNDFGIQSKQFNKHATATEIRAKLPRQVFECYFKFAFVRNPWDWMILPMPK